MIKEYRKIATIKAEKFDGSNEMIKKYNLQSVDYEIEKTKFGLLAIESKRKNKPTYFIETLEGFLELKSGDWIATGVNGEHWAIKDDIFKKTYQEVRK